MARPTLEEFDPNVIESQRRFLKDFLNRVLKLKGVQIVLLSGAVGSGKSAPMEHCGVVHALTTPRSIVGISRLGLPDLRDTLFKNIVEHTPERFIKGDVNWTSCKLKLINGSQFISKTFSDKKFKKVRSVEATAWLIEEITEHLTPEAFDEICMRVGRDGDIPNRFVMCATNPDSPEHWVYTKLIANAGYVDGIKTPEKDGRLEHVHVYYSITSDNPTLGEEYKKKNLANLSPKMAERMIYGKWTNVSGEGVYHAYDEEVHFHPTLSYKVDIRYPIYMNFDFNTAKNKPMSMCFFQYIDDHFHVFREFIVYKANTTSLMQEIVGDDKEQDGKGILDYPMHYIICGDCNGKNNMSSATMSDYAIIKDFLNRYAKGKVNYETKVPSQNPEVKVRHNTVNAYLKNLLNQIRISVYKTCPIVNLGFKNTQLKKGANYVEDDDYYAQHVLTALGYGICRATKKDSEIERIR